MPGGWESLIKVTGLLFGRFKLNTQGRPMWVWLKLNLTPRGDFCVVSVRYFVPELANIVTFHSKHQTKIKTTSIPVTFILEFLRVKRLELWFTMA